MQHLGAHFSAEEQVGIYGGIAAIIFLCNSPLLRIRTDMRKIVELHCCKHRGIRAIACYVLGLVYDGLLKRSILRFGKFSGND